jgi:hypothetical protein
MKTKHTYRGALMAAALIAAVSIFAAACGGGSETATTAASAVTTTADTAATGAAATDDTAAAPGDSTESGSVVVSGLVGYPMTFTAVDMDYMDWVTATAEDPTSGSASYDGVPLSDIWTFFGVQTDATTVVITGADGTTAEVTLADIGSDALLAVADDFSFNMVMPGLDGEAWVKDVVAMEFK